MQTWHSRACALAIVLTFAHTAPTRAEAVLKFGGVLPPKNPIVTQALEPWMRAVETASGRGVPSWLELNAEQFRGSVLDVPKREDIRLPIQEQLIVELYSK